MKRRMLRGVACALGAILILTVAIVAGLRWWTPSVTSVMWLEPGPPSALEYRPVARAEISSAAAKAVIAAEDQKFMTHSGFDFASLRQSVDQYLAGGQLRGASTISQQVAKNLFLWNGRSYLRKLVEAYFTVLIEWLWPKERVLEMYLNIAEFGPGVFGIEAAARRYLGKSAARLTVTEAALLAAVLPSPKRLSAGRPGPHVRARQAEIGAQVRLLEQRGHYAGLDW